MHRAMAACAGRARGTRRAVSWLATAALVAAAGSALATDPDLGRDLAAGCAACHGSDGHARGDAVKPLAGMPAAQIVAAFDAFGSGARPATVMHQIARGYRDDQVRALAAYFAAQSPRR